MAENSSWRSATRAVHGGIERSLFGETSEALFLTQGFVYESAEQAEKRFKGEVPGFVYSRYGNPTVTMFEERMALVEGGEAAIATATGMAAVTTALMALLKAGDHIIAARALFGGCRYVVDTFLPRFGVECTLVDGTDISAWEAAVQDNTRVLFFESPSNPLLELVDIAGVVRLAGSIGARVVVDNVFATPCYQNPLKSGVDLVIYSATKHIDGQGRCLAGVIIGSKALVGDYIYPLIRQTGPSLNPFNAWVMLKSLETLDLRVDKMTDNAAYLAEALSHHSGVIRLFYPHDQRHPQFALAKRQMRRGSTLLSFELKDKATAFQVLNRLKLIKLSNNLGDAKSLITHPATTTHQRFSDEERQQLGICEGLVRLSVGLEDVNDLLDDLHQALEIV